MTPERKEEIEFWYRVAEKAQLIKYVHDLLAALEEAENKLTEREWMLKETLDTATRLEGRLAEAQQTIARQRETWQELKNVVSTNATGGRGEDINDYDIMLNIMSDLEGEQP